jgi:hypothetical protein
MNDFGFKMGLPVAIAFGKIEESTTWNSDN